MNNIDNIEGIIGSSDNFISKVGNCYLTKSEEEILKRYDINYMQCKNTKELVYLIEDYLETDNNDELEWLSSNLAERSYYIDTNK